MHNCMRQLQNTGRVVQDVWERMIQREKITKSLGECFQNLWAGLLQTSGLL